MRLPYVSSALAAWVVWLGAGVATEAPAASEPPLTTSCMELSEPKPAEDVLPAAARPAPVPTPLDQRQVSLQETYADVFGILSRENECSRFFGGPARAAEAFNQFARRLGRSPLGDARVAIQMSGGFTSYQNLQTGVTYRLFERATINLDGPLGPSAPRSAVAATKVGRYAAHTRPARALILLHELGHLVPGPDGGWLLPNDGGDYLLSRRNTERVEARCAEQLEAIRD
ncbi:MAG TPA: hypothetical protein VG148_16125 [Pyrinomonadaceae bacterium]|nr:hypothetical protein [Pyrinomonadaceae bacterium]